jgi:uncharacterized protein YggU (UPF0235/DUF167 family)
MIRVSVHTHPGSKVASVGGSHDGALSVHVRARAIDGLATAEVLEVVADAFDVRPNAVTLVRGATARTKLLAIEGDERRLRTRLEELLLG